MCVYMTIVWLSQVWLKWKKHNKNNTKQIKLKNNWVFVFQCVNWTPEINKKQTFRVYTV